MREYGDARRNETVFQNLLSYSPLHNVRVPMGSQQYPATLIYAGKHHFPRLSHMTVSFDRDYYSHIDCIVALWL